MPARRGDSLDAWFRAGARGWDGRAGARPERRAPRLLLLACACASAPDTQEQVEARRPEVLEALYRQLALVLHRQEELAHRTDKGVEEERREMSLLAAGIALRIVRIDPDEGRGRLAAMMGHAE